MIDGNVDEPAWAAAEVGGDFYQTDPKNGYPSTERTEFRILYDEDNIYVSVICWQEGPITISELKREFAPVDGDQIVLFFDTFDDDRNGFGFHTNPASAMRDAQVSRGDINDSWDGVYHVASKIQEPGWTTEFEIPFKTLRFDEGRPEQRWGFNMERIIRHKNEFVQWSPAPIPFKVYEPLVAGQLEGLEGIRQGRNLYIKPFVVGGYTPDGRGPNLDKGDFDAGLDVKYGVTSGLTLDLTVNTDFSQVEADTQQVNLTRFSLFFPRSGSSFSRTRACSTSGAAARDSAVDAEGAEGRKGRRPRRDPVLQPTYRHVRRWTALAHAVRCEAERPAGGDGRRPDEHPGG